MREHIRREAGQSTDAGWWLVPTVFAIAALAAVAMRDDLAPETLPVQAASPPSVNPSPSPVLRPGGAVEVAEHVQAF